MNGIVLNLVRKDLLVLRWYYLFVALYALLFGLIITKGTFMLLGALPAVMMLVIGSGLELKNRSLVFIGSLPVTRGQIVRARYATALVFTAAGIAVTVIMNLINRYALGREHGFSGLMIAFIIGIVLFFSAIYLPAYYWLGSKGEHVALGAALALIVLAAFVMSGLLGGIYGSGYELGARLSAWPPVALGGLVVAASALLFVLSGCISYRIVRSKDLGT